LTDDHAQGITDVADKIVFDGDGGTLDAADLGTDDDDNANDSSLSGTSGSSGGGARMRSEREERDTAEALVTLSVPGVIVEVVVVPEYFSCCVDTHCRSFDDQTSTRQLCINCNCIAHLACSENFVFQNPFDMEFVVTVKDFTRVAKSRIRATPKSHYGNLAKIRAAKEMKKVKKMPDVPRKSTNVKFPNKILLELHRLAAFHSQAFVFLECEKTNRAGTYALMVERFYGNPEKRIKGVCNQLIDVDNAFVFLYNRGEGENGIELTLKPICCGNCTSSNYVAGVHFTTKIVGCANKM
jgi:hypothetical protein